ncbi:CFT2-like protein [Fusarium denticulatum]|uniref:CFT2-like protein n=1 Tax=Fusarium denticulatum TaxID=48507 RepID=A0A8H5WVJ9_9HYPO|nr:CFT2-like protein [Fusarium denticulatum]
METPLSLFSLPLGSVAIKERYESDVVSGNTDTGSARSVDVYTLEVGVVVDASVDTNVWIVKLADPNAKMIKWRNVRCLGFAISLKEEHLISLTRK